MKRFRIGTLSASIGSLFGFGFAAMFAWIVHDIRDPFGREPFWTPIVLAIVLIAAAVGGILLACAVLSDDRDEQGRRADILDHGSLTINKWPIASFNFLYREKAAFWGSGGASLMCVVRFADGDVKEYRKNHMRYVIEDTMMLRMKHNYERVEGGRIEGETYLELAAPADVAT